MTDFNLVDEINKLMKTIQHYTATFVYFCKYKITIFTGNNSKKNINKI